MSRSLKKLCLRALARHVLDSGTPQMECSAVVFSPHYDDETLGVGGTIIQKRRRGAKVHLVFMTDGSRSHAAMDSRRLSALRKEEALGAAKVLGVDADEIHFLNFPEMSLLHHSNEAVARVSELLSRIEYRQIFLPTTLEPLIWSADHRVTTEIVFAALNRIGRRPEILEYAVWFWYHWPWVPLFGSSDSRRLIKLTCQNLFGLSAWMGFNAAVPIVDVSHQKRAALEMYSSQMTRLVSDKSWPVLGDVAQGEFLDVFFQKIEFFKRYTYAVAHNA